MKTLSFSFLCFLLSSQGYAENYVPVHVLTIDQNVDTSLFVGPHKDTVLIDHDYEESERPSIRERDQIFSALNLQDQLTSFDEFARDELFSRAAYFSVDELKEKYKSIPKSSLASLKTAVLAWKQKHEAKQ